MIWVLQGRVLLTLLLVGTGYGFWVGYVAAALVGLITFAGLVWLDRRLSRREARQLSQPLQMYIVGSNRGWEPYRRE